MTIKVEEKNTRSAHIMSNKNNFTHLLFLTS